MGYFFILLFLPQEDCFDVSKKQLAALGILNHEYLNVFLLVVVLLLFVLPVACSSLFLLVFFVIPLVDDDLSSFSFFFLSFNCFYVFNYFVYFLPTHIVS
jgi:hypothetical protein